MDDDSHADIYKVAIYSGNEGSHVTRWTIPRCWKPTSFDHVYMIISIGLVSMLSIDTIFLSAIFIIYKIYIYTRASRSKGMLDSTVHSTMMALFDY